MSNHEQAQHNLALMGCLEGESRQLSYEEIAYLPTEQAAFRYCIQKSRCHRTQEDLAKLLGVAKGDLNCMLNADQNKRPKYMSRTRQINLQKLCGNKAIDQWADLYEKEMLVCQKTPVQQLKELEAARAVLLAKMSNE